MKCIVILLLFSLNALTNCYEIQERGVDGGNAKLIVDMHNHLRNLISQGRVPGQPKGTNLKHMKYDGRLAQEAQNIANTCQFGHRKVTDNRWHAVGQNIYGWWSTGFEKGSDWSSAIQNWFDEYKIYKYGDQFTTGAGHYTQIVWANTEYVGCGYTSSFKDGQYQKLYVCNYGPAGNYVGQRPYAT